MDLFTKTIRLTFILTLCVVILGAYVRLSDAGLGCPDWPGCYGQIAGIPDTAAEILESKNKFPNLEVDAAKAWKEMVHRYFAGGLGLLIFLLALYSSRSSHNQLNHRKYLYTLVLLVIFQALLGMWTVTMLLKPLVVVLHLAGGFLILSLLWWLNLKISNWANILSSDVLDRRFGVFIVVSLVVLSLQILLGGWTSSNYAALACTDFPTCAGRWWPQDANLAKAFTLWSDAQVNYEFGVLQSSERMAIHMFHRIGALFTGLLLFALIVLGYLRCKSRMFFLVFTMILFFLLLQIGLGISNVIFSLPLWVAVAHNAVGALLLLSLLTLFYMYVNIRNAHK
jgi:cytochrome c oxidase assembly protein subunit 15